MELADYHLTIISLVLCKIFSTGIPQMGVPPVEPLILEEVDPFDVAGLRFKLQDILCTGASSMTVTSIRGSLESHQLEVDTSLDEVWLSANVQLCSSISLVPLVLQGQVTANVKDMKFFAVIQTEIVGRNNEDFLNVTSLDVRMTVAPAIGELWLGGQRMNLISQIVSTPFNSQIITNTLRIGLEPTLTSLVGKFARRLFSSMP